MKKYMNKFIKSEYFVIERTAVENSKVLYISKKDDTVYTTINVDKDTSLSLGGDIITISPEGLIELRIKLHPQVQNIPGELREFDLYDRTTKNITKINSTDVLKILTSKGFSRVLKSEFNPFELIPVV